jgi:hypothetical protein
LTSALVGGEWSASRPGRFNPGERASDTLWIGGWVDLRSDLDDLEKRKFINTYRGRRSTISLFPIRNIFLITENTLALMKNILNADAVLFQIS